VSGIAADGAPPLPICRRAGIFDPLIVAAVLIALW